jgi:hypothetical protein
MSVIYNGRRDLTMKQAGGSPGMRCDLLFFCGHKGGITGAKFRAMKGVSRIPLRCAACEKARVK